MLVLRSCCTTTIGACYSHGFELVHDIDKTYSGLIVRCLPSSKQFAKHGFCFWVGSKQSWLKAHIYTLSRFIPRLVAITRQHRDISEDSVFSPNQVGPDYDVTRGVVADSCSKIGRLSNEHVQIFLRVGEMKDDFNATLLRMTKFLDRGLNGRGRF